MTTIKIKNRDGKIRTGSILREHEESDGTKWVTMLCENDDVETLPAANIVKTFGFDRWRSLLTMDGE